MISPFLWFERDAVKAAKFYASIFKGSKISKVTRLENTPSGTVEVVEATLLGTKFTLMSAGPYFKINPAISFVIDCKNQKEVDYYWKKLSAVPKAEQCGWLQDRFGVTWQVVPRALGKMLADKNKAKVARVQAAFMKMKKFDINALKKAYGQSA